MKSYCNATGAPIGIWSNGDIISFYHRKDPNHFEDIPAIPSSHEKLSAILPFTQLTFKPSDLLRDAISRSPKGEIQNGNDLKNRRQQTAMVDGKPVTIGLNAYIKP